VHLASISGGTDIVSCFVLGVPTRPVWIGEIQGPALGMAVDVWDEDGGRSRARRASWSAPAPSLHADRLLERSRRRQVSRAYFERFDNVWCHGDFAEWTEHGGMIIHGRSDATLNPGGVRIGTAEIYNQVEQLPEILESICIGQDWDGDTRVVLFVRLAEGVGSTRNWRSASAPRSGPAPAPATCRPGSSRSADIPRTKSGKITELAVRDIVHGRPVKNKEALANPEALDLYADLPNCGVRQPKGWLTRIVSGEIYLDFKAGTNRKFSHGR
jgi:acetoacetyl-CoA synthetase